MIRELIQNNATKTNLEIELMKLLNDQPYADSIKSEYEKLYQLLDTGSASENTARLICEHLNRE